MRSEATFVKQKCKEQTVQEGSGKQREVATGLKKAKRNEKKVRNVKFDMPAAKYPCKYRDLTVVSNVKHSNGALTVVLTVNGGLTAKLTVNWHKAVFY